MADMAIKKQAIPAKLFTGLFYAEVNCGSILSYQGAYVFDLDASTISSLRAEGLHFFDDIEDPRNRALNNYFGGEWLETPLPANKREGMLANMHCAMGESRRWPKAILPALSRPGAYYQTGGGRTLIVMPEIGYVVAIASDR